MSLSRFLLGLSAVSSFVAAQQTILVGPAGVPQPVVLFASLGIGTVAVPGIEPNVHLDLGQALPVGLMLTDAQGDAAWSVAVPNSPGLVNLAVWLQGIGGLGAPLQASPVTGGVIVD